MKIAFDLDSVFINIHDYPSPAPGVQGGWLWRYNRDWGHLKYLQHEDLTEWKIENTVHPACGARIYNYLSEDDFYDNAPPVEGSIEVFRQVVDEGHEPWFVTSGIHKGKYEWVRRHGLATLMDGGVKSKNIITIDDKPFLAPLFDLIVDDRAETCLEWEKVGGRAILLDQPWNRWATLERRAMDWRDVLLMIRREDEKQNRADQ